MMIENPENQVRLIDMKELAGMLKVSTKTLYRRRAEGAIPEPLRIGRLVRWDEDVVRVWIKQKCPPIVNPDNKAN